MQQVRVNHTAVHRRIWLAQRSVAELGGSVSRVGVCILSQIHAQHRDLYIIAFISKTCGTCFPPVYFATGSIGKVCCRRPVVNMARTATLLTNRVSVRNRVAAELVGCIYACRKHAVSRIQLLYLGMKPHNPFVLTRHFSRRTARATSKFVAS